MEVGPSVGSDGTCGELSADFDVNLKVMCWNVCGWSNMNVCQFGRGVDHTDHTDIKTTQHSGASRLRASCSKFRRHLLGGIFII